MDLAEATSGDVGVDLRGADAGVSEHFLDHAKIRPVFQEVGGKNCGATCGGHISRDAGAACAGLHADHRVTGAKAEPRRVRKTLAGDRGRTSWGRPESKVALKGFHGLCAHRDHAFLVPLPMTLRNPASRCSCSRRIPAVRPGAIPGVCQFQGPRGRRGGCRLGAGWFQPADFVVAQRLGQRFPPSGQGEEVFRGVRRQNPRSRRIGKGAPVRLRAGKKTGGLSREGLSDGARDGRVR